MRIALSSESTIDLTKEIISNNNIHIVPFTVVLGNKSEFDGVITPEEIISFVNENNVLPKTAAVNHIQYTDHFTNLLNDYDAVIHISLSSEISSAYSNAVIVSRELKNVYVIDSRSLSTGIALLALYARKLIDSGMEISEIVKQVEDKRNYVQASFLLTRLDYLYKGGRCNAIGYLAATLLRIRPQVIVENGKMTPKRKYIGRIDKSIMSYVEDTLNEFNNPDKENIFITTTTIDDAQLNEIKSVLEEKGFKNIYITHAGSTITSHCGESCIGILYINDGGK